MKLMDGDTADDRNEIIRLRREIERLRGLLKEARFYVADAGTGEEPGEHQSALLLDIDRILQ